MSLLKIKQVESLSTTISSIETRLDESGGGSIMIEGAGSLSTMRDAACNTASGAGSTVSGGTFNTASGTCSTV